VGVIGSCYLFGCGLGALLFSFIAVKYGRKSVLGITLIIYIVSTMLFSVSMCLEWMCVSRFMTGVGIGGEYTAIFSAVDEFIPT
jgi:MFS family permease